MACTFDEPHDNCNDITHVIQANRMYINRLEQAADRMMESAFILVSSAWPKTVLNNGTAEPRKSQVISVYEALEAYRELRSSIEAKPSLRAEGRKDD